MSQQILKNERFAQDLDSALKIYWIPGLIKTQCSSSYSLFFYSLDPSTVIRIIQHITETTLEAKFLSHPPPWTFAITAHYQFCQDPMFVQNKRHTLWLCSKYKIQIKTISRTEMIPKWRPVQVCCRGYARSSNGSNCEPVCSQRCYHGRCVEPDKCECQPGYGGPSCSKSCPSGKWGPDCGNDCPCLNGAKCDPLTGECTCTPGWQGTQCNIKCPYRSFGQDCKERCKCQNRGNCDHISGRCNCTAGWRGALCEEPCPPGTHGTECKSSCQCQNGGSCHPVDGKCYCPKGWTGQVCANPCPSGSFGLNCKEKCDCYNGGLCHHVNGQCQCLPGYKGDKVRMSIY
ncbi:Protein draper,Cell death abnormality protein 1,Multiple epidermal growth factor-like domains protein 10,Multiple epidermal growth factor-like domains protein 6,Multiple epidermal growth factor-like domains protein 11,Platelet endothelial aggregation receptor 1 [Lepeophtheirus salmonis]|uniref:EGF-like domain-containing protein n=1 Tax=Lepeophtheirus salmonis TaxID=72036 RepID=A0A7R8D447_LEPSM|nr:Protein draper,Cell death abnormality protein 1,Multiple epidermal growth factor-like domains protein 10,Multiple epidermal growth factor-like domains protein 6,Multiple epidermal growth factor-like domains protein 11,Platelet endothelial aggregation receptor 1 [Lepeophtheirus salmonis]CAF2970612.1 Protein draper,Cell death abnormality protein 1,Multiple epidermal growth factor-like domains protein 10,Multiple epidermal growth factor-like domains protein 6,Multiple epidermal growth factor-like 